MACQLPDTAESPAALAAARPRSLPRDPRASGVKIELQRGRVPVPVGSSSGQSGVRLFCMKSAIELQDFFSFFFLNG